MRVTLGDAVTKLPGESDWDAFINDMSLDVVEESDFTEYLTIKGFDRNRMSLGEIIECWNVYMADAEWYYHDTNEKPPGLQEYLARKRKS